MKNDTNAKRHEELCEAIFNADFADVAKLYRLINQDVVNVVVRYGMGGELVREVLDNGMNPDWMRRAQAYSVGVRRPRVGDAIRDIIEPAPIFKRGERFNSDDWYLCTTNAKYDDLTGLEFPQGTSWDLDA